MVSQPLYGNIETRRVSVKTYRMVKFGCRSWPNLKSPLNIRRFVVKIAHSTCPSYGALTARQLTSVTTAGRVSRRPPGQTASNASRRPNVWRSGQAHALLFGPSNKKALAKEARPAKPDYIRARPPSRQAGSKMDEATLHHREHRYVSNTHSQFDCASTS